MKAFVQNRQIFFICLVPILGFGIFSVANTAVRYLSTGAWAAVLLAAVLILPRGNYAVRVGKALFGRYADGVRAKGCRQSRG